MNDAAGSVGAERRPGVGYSWYVVVLLSIVYATNIADRFVLGAVVESVKADFRLSDTEVGLLTGLSFAILYAVLALPIAYIADRWNRRNVISIAIAVYAAASTLCGAAQSYLQLLVMRIGVATGEAGTSPASHSIISDLFPVERRTIPLSLLGIGASVGTWLGFSVGGFLGEHYSWRVALMALGGPGLLLALLVRTTVVECTRRAPRASPVATPSQSGPYTLRSALHVFWHRKALRNVVIAGTVFHLYGYAMNFLHAAYLVRSQHMSMSEAGDMVGFWFGLVGGNIGVLLCGTATEWLGRRDLRWHALAPACLLISTYPMALGTYLLHPGPLLTFCHVMLGISVNGMIGPLFALVQNLAARPMRAFVAAFLFFTLNIVGFGLGPLMVGIASDVLHNHFGFGVESLRFALAGDTCMILWAAGHLVWAARTLRRDYSDAAAQS